MPIPNDLYLATAEYAADTIERLCPLVLERMEKGMRNVRGMHYRIHAVQADDETLVLMVTGPDKPYPDGPPVEGKNLLLDTVAEMSVSERLRLAADLFDIA